MAYTISDVALAPVSVTSSDWISSDSWQKYSGDLVYGYDYWNAKSETLSPASESSYSALFRIEFSSSNSTAPTFYVYAWRLGDDSKIHVPFVLKIGTFATGNLFKVLMHKDLLEIQQRSIRPATLWSNIQRQLNVLGSDVVVDSQGKQYKIFIRTSVRTILHHKTFTVLIAIS
jgi:hypothetical protein